MRALLIILRWLSSAAALAGATTTQSDTVPSGCRVPLASPTLTVALPGNPWGVAADRAGCRVFVSVTGNGSLDSAAIAVLTRDAGRLELSRVVRLPQRIARGAVLTHDGRFLVTAADDDVVVLDVERLLSNDGDPIAGAFHNPAGSLPIAANVSPDDKLLFVSNENTASIAVIDMEKARATSYSRDAVVGSIPTGEGPIGLVFSRDGRWLYATSIRAQDDWQWPLACRPEGRTDADASLVRPEGAIVVVDVARAATDPEHAVAARVAAGCSPVRVAISPLGDRVYVTARNSNAVLAFDAEKLRADSTHARLGAADVGAAPVPLAVVDDGRTVVAASSNRFGDTDDAQSLEVLDARLIGRGNARLGAVATVRFPREMAVAGDGRTLFVTGFRSSALQVIDLTQSTISSLSNR